MMRQFREGDFLDECQEADLTGISEAAAEQFNFDGDLRDDHWVWEMAFQAAVAAKVRTPGF